jgi:hypothetical protein
MLIYKGLSAVAAAALGAAIVVMLPGFSPEAGANTPVPGVKSDRLDYRPTGKDCTTQAWPYYEVNCLRDRSRVGGEVKAVRIITTDRIAQ